jgi:hypothetical protein
MTTHDDDDDDDRDSSTEETHDVDVDDCYPVLSCEGGEKRKKETMQTNHSHSGSDSLVTLASPGQPFWDNGTCCDVRYRNGAAWLTSVPL